MGSNFWVLTCPISKKYIFKKWWLAPNTNMTTILFHSQCINYLNQLLEEINDWVKKTKKGSWQLYGFSHWHLVLLYWIKGLNIFPPLFLVKSCSYLFNVALTWIVVGIFINCIFTWCPKLYCAWLARGPSTSILISEHKR